MTKPKTKAKTKKTVKPKNEPVIEPESGEIDIDNMSDEQFEVFKKRIVDESYNIIMMPPIQMTPDRVAEAKAICTLRALEIPREQELEPAFTRAQMQAREYIFKVAMRVGLENGLRFVDVSLLLQQIGNESLSLALWEFNNMQAADMLLGVPTEDEGSPNPEDTAKFMNIFKGIGGDSSTSEGNEDDADDI